MAIMAGNELSQVRQELLKWTAYAIVRDKQLQLF